MGNLAKPLTQLAARMAYHTMAGQVPARILDGMTWYPYPQQRTEGIDDFPYCEFKGFTGGEVYRGAARTGLAQPTIVLQFEIAHKREAGQDELAKWIEKVMDALETDTNGVVNPNLDGTLRPFNMAITQNSALDASLTAVLSVTIEPKIVQRGQRRI